MLAETMADVRAGRMDPKLGSTLGYLGTALLRAFEARRVVAKVEFHFGELFPRVGFIVTNLENPSRAVVRFYNKRGTAEQWIKEGKQAVKMTRLSCHRFRSNQTTDEYLEQLTGEAKIPVRNQLTRTTKFVYVKTYSRNEALDLTVYCHAALFTLQRFLDPMTYADLSRLLALVHEGKSPLNMHASRTRGLRNAGIRISNASQPTCKLTRNPFRLLDCRRYDQNSLSLRGPRLPHSLRLF